MNLFASLVIWSLSKPKKDRTFQPDTVIMMSSNCELTGEPAENAKDIVFVTITGPAKWLAGPSLLKSDVASGATFHTSCYHAPVVYVAITRCLRVCLYSSSVNE